MKRQHVSLSSLTKAPTFIVSYEKVVSIQEFTEHYFICE